jgi:trehalose 6-phosphate phosphatase
MKIDLREGGQHMQIEILNIPDFWLRLRESPNRFLGLDYDGTLAPFRINPLEAYPLPEIAGMLKAIVESRSTTVAIVSGRPVQEIVALLGTTGVTVVGCHGFELRRPNGMMVAKSPSPGQLSGLERAMAIAVQFGWERRLEDKIASIAFHTRGEPSGIALKMEEKIFSEWIVLGPPHDLEVRKFNGGLEIRAMGRNKGDAFIELLPEDLGDNLSVYVGDDETDEDVFRMIRGRGIGIKVGEPTAGTAATGFLPDCEAVRAFLRTWCSITQ